MPKNSLADKSISPKTIANLKALGQNIKTARLRPNITQQEMAGRTFMPRNRLRKIEHGDPSVGLGALAQVLEHLGFIDQLMLAADPDTDDLGKALEMKNKKQEQRENAFRNSI